MADLHEALQSLSPVDWDEVPKDDIKPYIEQLTKACEVICNSLPSPPDSTPFEESTLQFSKANEADTAAETKPSYATAPTPSPELLALQSHWGKPIKFSAKDNPYNVSVYKTAGRDRHGAWFARRSVHEGISYSKFANAMKQELPTTLAVKGGPGAGSVRGIGADQRLEQLNAGDAGKIEVYQMSAQFPGPTTPREFITMLVTSESPAVFNTSQQARQVMLISKPVSHPEAPERAGYVHGQYESVELVREIPLHLSSSKPTPESAPTDTVATASGSEDDAAELNPVEWIMITRSDPGGGIPRFMVDRGTPSTMLGDITKFLNFASKLDATEGSEIASTLTETAVLQNGSHSKDGNQASIAEGLPSAANEEAVNGSGVFRQLTTALEAGLDAYAPTMVSSFVHNKFDPAEPVYSSSDSSTVSSTVSFISAPDLQNSPAYPSDDKSLALSSLSIDSELKKDQGVSGSSTDKHHEKELQKIKEAREKVERRLAKKRDEENEKLKKSQDEEQSETSKALERHNKEIKKQEERHQKELEKLEAKRERRIKKYEEKKRKQEDRNTMQKVVRERDDFRSQVDLLKRENAVLRERIEVLESS